MRLRTCYIFFSLGASVWLGQMALAADADKGKVIAQRWCASCHLVSPEQNKASVDVPSFMDIAKRRSDGKSLSTFLADPHPVMPQMALTRDDVADVVRYIQSFNPDAIPVTVPEKDRKPADPFRG